MLYSIYLIKNELNGKCYIGRTNNFPLRKSTHLSLSRKDLPKYHIHRAIKKYGENNFSFIILKENIKESDINFEEMKYIEIYDTFVNGYNMTIRRRR